MYEYEYDHNLLRLYRDSQHTRTTASYSYGYFAHFIIKLKYYKTNGRVFFFFFITSFFFSFASASFYNRSTAIDDFDSKKCIKQHKRKRKIPVHAISFVPFCEGEKWWHPATHSRIAAATKPTKQKEPRKESV